MILRTLYICNIENFYGSGPGRSVLVPLLYETVEEGAWSMYIAGMLLGYWNRQFSDILQTLVMLHSVL